MKKRLKLRVSAVLLSAAIVVSIFFNLKNRDGEAPIVISRPIFPDAKVYKQSAEVKIIPIPRDIPPDAIKVLPREWPGVRVIPVKPK